jgi:hypothetical protein
VYGIVVSTIRREFNPSLADVPGDSDGSPAHGEYAHDHRKRDFRNGILKYSADRWHFGLGYFTLR